MPAFRPLLPSDWMDIIGSQVFITIRKGAKRVP
jgi:hypothetical protein